MKVPKIVVDADLFILHLTGDQEPSLLRQAFSKFFCYTTVFQAVELFSLGRSSGELRAIEDSMASVKVLGLNAKNARWYGSVIRQRGDTHALRTMAAAMCVESRLPLLTGRHRLFQGFAGLTVVRAGEISRYGTGEEILRAAARKKRRGETGETRVWQR